MKNRKFIGMDSDFPLFNEMTGGLGSDLYVFAGGSAHGKTTFLVQLGWNLLTCNPHSKLLFFSLDQNRIDITAKLTSLIARIPISYVRIPNPSVLELDEKRVNALQIIADTSDDMFLFDESDGRITLDDIREAATEIRSEHNGELIIVVDSLQRLSSVDDDWKKRSEYLGWAAGQLRLLAREMRATVLLTLGLHGDAELRRPQKSDLLFIPEILRESHSLFTIYCDYIINPGTPFLEWEWEKSTQENPEPVVPIAELSIMKNKMEPNCGRLYYKYMESMARFQECIGVEVEHYEAMISNLEEHKEKKENLKLQQQS